jgi:hypothetical protein
MDTPGRRGDRATDRSTPPIPTTGRFSKKPSPPSTRRSIATSVSRKRFFLPLLANRGAGDMIRLLTEEHAVIIPLGRGLSEVVARALEHGFDGSGWNDFARSHKNWSTA